MPETTAQTQAIHTRGMNLVVVAGAGSGKTRVLVERYLSLLAEGYALSSIVAITFTEKTAREMRDRVRRRIEAQAANAMMPDELAKWETCRQQIDAAYISTIHSLCAALLRANPAEAQVDPYFDVLEEADALIWQQEAIDAVLTELAEHGGDELALLGAYDITTVRDVLMSLLARGAYLDDVFAHMPAEMDALLAHWQVWLQQAQRDGLKHLRQDARWQETTDWIRKNAASDERDALEMIRAEFAVALDGLVNNNDLAQTWTAIRDIGQRKVGNVGRKNAWDDVKAARQVLIALRDCARAYADDFDLSLDEHDHHAALLIQQWRTLWTHARRAYAERKTRNRALDFNDLEDKARTLLRSHPEVCERYHAEFSCVLVDEFQDTNAAQRDIIYALAAPEEPDRLFIVADGKQSVYGFRGADVSVFTETVRHLTRAWGDGARVVLGESFRAHSRLVRAFNHLFARIFQIDGEPAPYQIAFEPMSAPRPSLEREPLMEIITVPVEVSERKLSAEECRQWEGQEIAARLQSLIDERFQVWDRDMGAYRDLRWGDVVLLFRATTHLALYEEAFKAARIPYVTLAGKDYYDRAEVRDLVYLLRALDNPFDDLSLAVALRSPLYVLSDETLYHLRREQKHFRERLAAIPDEVIGDERQRAQFAYQSLERLWARVGRVPILDLLKEALADTDYLATVMSLSDGERRRGNVEKLLALARRTGLVRLSEFNAHLQELTVQEVREGEALIEAENAAQLMTIHRAKGLEFPVVVIPDASRARRESYEVLLVNRPMGVAVSVNDVRGKRVEPVAYRLMKLEEARRDEAEEKRLLYVAMTRAQDYLIISGSTQRNDKSYLGQILSALDGMYSHEWGTVAIRNPLTSLGTTTVIAFQLIEPSRADSEGTIESELPALVRPLVTPAISELHSFSATGLQELACAPKEFERRIIEGAPQRMPPATHDQAATHVPAYVVGEMAHRAIQRWRFPHSTANLDNILVGYAHEQGLTDPQAIQIAVRQSQRLLDKFTQSALYSEMERALVRRHELPFIAQWEGRIVHGALDSLYQAADAQWFLVDFKTDGLDGRDAPTHTIEKYGVQLTIYQHAIEIQMGIEARVQVHYIRESITIEISHADLNNARERAKRAL